MPRSAIFLLSDPDEFRAAVPELQMSLLIAGPGVFQVQLNRIELKHSILLSCDESLPRVAHVSLARHSVFLFFPTRKAEPVGVAGLDVEFGDLVVCGPRRFFMRTTGPVGWGCILFKPSRLSGTRRLNAGCGFDHPECGWIARPARPLIRRLLRLHREAAQSALNSPGSITDPGSAAELEQLLMEAARGCVASAEGMRIDTSDQSQLSLMNRFQDIVRASSGKLVSQADLEANLGVSGRTLRSYCQKHLGMSPARYLRLHRMTLIRRALLRADPANCTVQEIASHYGFNEAGRFAVAYRALYGDFPSATLHQVPGSSPVSAFCQWLPSRAKTA